MARAAVTTAIAAASAVLAGPLAGMCTAALIVGAAIDAAAVVIDAAAVVIDAAAVVIDAAAVVIAAAGAVITGEAAAIVMAATAAAAATADDVAAIAIAVAAAEATVMNDGRDPVVEATLCAAHLATRRNGGGVRMGRHTQ